MRTWLHELDVEVGGRLTRGRRCYLHLLLNYLLLLLFKFVDEVGGEFEDHCYEGARDRLVHEVLELDLLTYEVDGGAGLLE